MFNSSHLCEFQKNEGIGEHQDVRPRSAEMNDGDRPSVFNVNFGERGYRGFGPPEIFAEGHLDFPICKREL